MTFLDRLERHLGRFAIPGLIRYIVALNALVFILGLTNPGYIEMLLPDRAAIMRGEVWRLISWAFIPNTFSLIWIIFYLMFTWWIGDMLESTWGSFRLNVYYLLGLLGGTVSALVFGVSAGNYVLSFTLLAALATMAPNLEMYLYFLPVKAKWMAFISLAILAVILPQKLTLVVGSINYLVFFVPYFLREAKNRQEVQTRRAKFEEAKKDESPTLHRCVVCGKTEESDPSAVFRVADDDEEYCQDHLPREPLQAA